MATRTLSIALPLTLAVPSVLAALIGACSGDEPEVLPAPFEDAAPPPPEDAGAPEASAPLEVPASLVETLSVKPYVEGTCTDVKFPGWPHEAKRCTYRNGLVVTVANPPPERVARWIVEASRLIPALEGLRERDHDAWEEGLEVIARHTLGQSSRIFPLAGQVWEDGTVYRFERGVTSTCTTGCYCRINSTSRPAWCKYAAEVLKTGDEDACLRTMGQTTSRLTDPWLEHCLANHDAAWTSDANEHYRAMAWNANLALAAKFPDPTKASGADVVAALLEEYPR